MQQRVQPQPSGIRRLSEGSGRCAGGGRAEAGEHCWTRMQQMQTHRTNPDATGIHRVQLWVRETWEGWRAADQEEVGHPRTHAPARTHPRLPPARALSSRMQVLVDGCSPPRPALLLLHPALPLLLTSRLPPLTPLCSSSPPFLSPASSPFSPLSTPACPTLLRAAGRCTTPPDAGGCSAARCSAVRLCVAR